MLLTLLVYSFTHAFVDASCVAAIFYSLKTARADPLMYFNLVVLYNVLAFGLQAPLGYLVDKLKNPRLSAVLGCIFAAFSIIAMKSVPLLTICLAGIGNALFHIGGGSVSLNIGPKKAAAPGIFVAPGAFGLAVGILVGKGGNFLFWPFVLLLGVSVVVISLIKIPKINYRQEIASGSIDYFWLIFFFLMFSVFVRSLIGMVVVFPWKTNMTLFWSLTLAVVGGKAVGGILADRFGWKKIGVASLLISAPLISFTANFPFLAIAGMFLFNMTMPITLAAIFNVLPGRPAFAFGLTCLALILGALPTFFGFKEILGGKEIIFWLIIGSAITIFTSLKLILTHKLKHQSGFVTI